jgi:hypothetical protein
MCKNDGDLDAPMIKWTEKTGYQKLHLLTLAACRGTKKMKDDCLMPNLDYPPPTTPPTVAAQPPVVVYSPPQGYSPSQVQVPPVKRKKKGLSAGGIVAIVLGSVSIFALLCLIVGVFVMNVSSQPPADQVVRIVSWDWAEILSWDGDESSIHVATCQNTSDKTLSFVEISLPLTFAITDGHSGLAVGIAYDIPPGATFEVNVIPQEYYTPYPPQMAGVDLEGIEIKASYK